MSLYIIEWQVQHFQVHSYFVLNYKNEIKKELEVDEVNDDSLGADFYEIDKLSKDELSSIAILELEKLGYKLK